VRPRQLQHGGDDVAGVGVNFVPHQHGTHFVPEAAVELLRGGGARQEPCQDNGSMHHARTWGRTS
jgi:hypothetical protein